MTDTIWNPLAFATMPEPLFGKADGYDANGLDADGYDREGFKPDPWDGTLRDRGGYDEDGYDEDGEDADGFNRDGYREDGDGTLRDRRGFDLDGYDRDGYDHDGYNEDGYNEDGYDRDGYDTWGDGRYRDTDWLQNDNPALVFYATEEEGGVHETRFSYRAKPPVKDIPFYGMEIELTSDNNDEVQEVIEDYSHVWAKEDCSVEGFEMCAHPMTAAYAQENFKWDIVDSLARAGCEVRSESNGLHIHVSRGGFRNYAHIYSWLKFLWHNEEKVTWIGGRQAYEWGSFKSAQALKHFSHLKAQMKSYRHGGHPVYEYSSGPDRYTAVNLRNENTLEVRVFASANDSETLRYRFELVAASVEYTRTLPVAKIRDDGWEWNAFVSWLIKNEGTYPALERKVVPSMVIA
jgi:hypothetical protein